MRRLRITLRKSGIGRPQAHKAVLKGLGLVRLQKTVVLPDNLCVRGMIRKVAHLVQVEEETVGDDAGGGHAIT